MMESPDDNLDHFALGYYAPGKGLARESVPYAEGTQAHAQWLAGYDAAVRGDPAPAGTGRS
ncbi:ribosome modulation factor [Methylobacterium sp. Leaf466]|nr:ribosome modulation factor [Methylobacterium sp. Leaf108]KQT78219.1 ribosome modulation factor [Methylobacterium sp. Leaf466]